MTARTVDVLVVGAGPAGSLAARALAHRGLEVELVERDTFPRRKVCGCCLHPAGVATLDDEVLLTAVDRAGAVPLGEAVLHAAGRVARIV